MRFYDVNGGSIKVSGKDVRNVTRKSFRQFIRKEKEDWLEFFELIGLKTTAQQLLVGIAIGILLLFILGGAEWIHDKIVGGI